MLIDAEATFEFNWRVNADGYSTDIYDMRGKGFGPGIGPKKVYFAARVVNTAFDAAQGNETYSIELRVGNISGNAPTSISGGQLIGALGIPRGVPVGWGTYMAVPPIPVYEGNTLVTASYRGLQAYAEVGGTSPDGRIVCYLTNTEPQMYYAHKFAAV